ncbi:MAG: DUF262 domain-containing HNH endonuclease family protein [Actinomycetota bacterium]
MTKIENYKYSIHEAFRDCFYIVPDYQREYVWEEKNVTQLLEDIYEEFQKNNMDNEYFIGTIIVAKENKFFEVIDGQQRLTTLFLILATLKELLKEEQDYVNRIKQLLSETYPDKDGKLITNFKLELKYENSHDFIKTLVVEQNNIKDSNNRIEINDQKGSLLRLSRAYNYSLNFLQNNFEDKGDLKKFYGFLSNQVNFIQIETDIHGALKVFETINDRGVGLNPMDLLKNLLFRNTNKTDFDKLRKEWEKITKPLEKNKQKPLRFLRYFLMANYTVKNKKGEPIVREDEIYDWITNKTNAEKIDYEGKPFEFVRNLQDNVNAYIMFYLGKYVDGSDMKYLDNIKKLSGSFSQHLILLLAARKLNKNYFTYFCKQIESLLFYYIITRTPTKEFERKFSKWADEIREIALKDDISQKDEIFKFVENQIKPELDTKEPSYKYHFMEFNYNSMQQYRLRYILAKIEHYLNKQWYGKESDTLTEFMKGEIEHILPNQPTEELKSEFEKENSDVEYGDYKLKLGNLSLLEKPINIVAGRNFFEDKKIEYRKSNFILTKSLVGLEEVGKNTSINRMNKELKSFEEWNKLSIDERQEMLFNISKKIWKIEETLPIN